MYGELSQYVGDKGKWHGKTIQLANGETMAYRKRSGGGHPLVLVHGNMTSSKHWDILMDALDEKYTIYALDLRGFGESSYLKPITAIKDFSDDVKLFVDALQLQSFDMIGWSTGGAVCMQFAANYPGHCQRLILLASASTRGYPFYTDLEQAIQPPLSEPIIMRRYWWIHPKQSLFKATTMQKCGRLTVYMECINLYAPSTKRGKISRICRGYAYTAQFSRSISCAQYI